MATKEATVFLIDLSQYMGARRPDSSQTNLDWIKVYLWDKLSDKVLAGRKTDYVGVVAFGTDVTDHGLREVDHDYDHISRILLLPDRDDKAALQSYKLGMQQLDHLREELTVNKTAAGDVLSAVVIGLEVLNNFCHDYRIKKNLILLTSGQTQTDLSSLEEIAARITQLEVELTVLGIDFDDVTRGYAEPNKSKAKLETERGLKLLAEQTNGRYATYAEAYESTKTPRVKEVRSGKLFTGLLTLGNVDQSPNVIQIDVEAFARTMVARGPTSVKLGAKTSLGFSQAHAFSSISDNDASVRVDRTYKLDDGRELDDKAELEKGYTYGRTVVRISQYDAEYLTYKTHPALEIYGFVESAEYKRYLSMGTTVLICPQKANDRASLALSSVVHALYETAHLALARYVRKANTPATMVLLGPYLETDAETLIMAQLPFADDVRQFKFAPLDRIRTARGMIRDSHRFLPTKALDSAMAAFVDSALLELPLETEEEDKAGPQVAELLPPEDCYSIGVHRLKQEIVYRAMHPGSEQIRSPDEALLRPSSALPQTRERIGKTAATLGRIADVKKVPPKAVHKRKRGHASEVPAEALDLENLLDQGLQQQQEQDLHPKRQKNLQAQQDLERPAHLGEVGDAVTIGQDDPLRDFERLMRDDKRADQALRQVQPVLEDMIQHSLGSSSYAAASELLRAFRKHAHEQDEKEMFDEFLDVLEQKCRDEWDRSDFWTQAVKEQAARPIGNP